MKSLHAERERVHITTTGGSQEIELDFGDGNVVRMVVECRGRDNDITLTPLVEQKIRVTAVRPDRTALLPAVPTRTPKLKLFEPPDIPLPLDGKTVVFAGDLHAGLEHEFDATVLVRRQDLESSFREALLTQPVTHSGGVRQEIDVARMAENAVQRLVDRADRRPVHLSGLPLFEPGGSHQPVTEPGGIVQAIQICGASHDGEYAWGLAAGGVRVRVPRLAFEQAPVLGDFFHVSRQDGAFVATRSTNVLQLDRD